MTADLEIQIAHSVEEVGQAAWDRLGGGRPFTSYRWYRFGERVMEYATPIYAILSRCGEPVGRATFWLTGRELLPIDSAPVRRVMQRALRRWPLLMCQAPLSSAFTSGLILPEPPLREAARQAVVRLAGDLLRRYGASFCLFPYLLSGARQEAWRPACFWITMSEPGTRLDIVWQDVEGYLAQLGKKRRYNLRRSYRLADELGIEVKRFPAVTDVDRAFALHENVNRRHGTGTEPWMRAAFEHAGMVDAEWLAAERDGQLVGCELMLGDNGAWFVTGLGLDYTLPHVYFRLSYADIECAIERGAKMLRWGSGAYEVKRRLGFEVEDNNHVAVLAANKVLCSLGHRLAAMEQARAAEPPAE